MKRTLLVLCLALLAGGGPGTSPTGGTVTGRVTTLDGSKAIAATDVWVYLEQIKPRRKAAPKPDDKVAIHQRARNGTKVFEPHVRVVPTGSTVWFPNDDTEEHNVFTPEGPPGFKNLGRYSTDAKGSGMELPDPGEVDFFCDIHQQMWAKVKVVESDYIAEVVDQKFKLDHVLPGTYKVRAWAPGFGEVVSGEVVVEDGKASDAGELHPHRGKPAKPHTRIDGSPYRCPPYCNP